MSPHRIDRTGATFVDESQPVDVLWVSDKMRTDAFVRWQQLFPERESLGVLPLLLRGLGVGGDDPTHDRPWRTGELRPATVDEMARLDIDRLFEDLWHRAVAALEPVEQVDLLRHHGFPSVRWLGLARPRPWLYNPDECAIEVASAVRIAMLALVPAQVGSAAIATVGWLGPAGYATPAEVGAVLASWEQRFGVTVIEIGFGSLLLSVAAPPHTLTEAVPIALEHHAFCPQLIYRSPRPGATCCNGGWNLQVYAQSLIDATYWEFQWN